MPNPYGRPRTGKYRTCYICNKSFYVPGWRIKANDGRGKYCSNECRYKARSKEYVGKGNPQYIDGRTELLKNLYLTKEWRKLRKEIYKRDGYECVMCGKHGGRLHAHHLIEVGICEDPFDPDIIVTLCHKCHCKVTRREHGNKDKNESVHSSDTTKSY